MSIEAKANYNQRLVQRLLISIHDLAEAGCIAQQLLSLRLHDPGVDWESDDFMNGDYWVLKGLTIGMVVSYARPFAASRGHALPKLPDKLLRCLDPEELDLHREVCALRHRAYAHSDSDGYDVTLAVSSDSDFALPLYQALPERLFERSELETFNLMTVKLEGAIEARVNEILQRPSEETEGLTTYFPPQAT